MKNRMAMGGLATVWNSSSSRPSPVKRTKVAMFCVSPLSFSSWVTVFRTVPSSSCTPSMASTMLRTVGTPWSVVSSFRMPALAGLGERHGPVLQLVAVGPRSTSRALEREQLAGVPETAAGHHGGDVGHAEQLGRQAVGAGAAGGPHPDADGHRRIGDRLQQVAHRLGRRWRPRCSSAG